MACLDCQVAGADEVALRVLGDLAGDEDQPAAGRDDDLRVRLWRRQVGRVDEVQGHRCVLPCVVGRAPCREDRVWMSSIGVRLHHTAKQGPWGVEDPSYLPG